jgi:uncharacterized membrane protein YtjA (UPF0391 family)
MAITGPAGTSPTEPNHLEGDLTMLRLAILFLVIALIAGFFGFGGVENYSWAGAKILFFAFIVLAVLSFLGHGFRRRSYWR